LLSYTAEHHFKQYIKPIWKNRDFYLYLEVVLAKMVAKNEFWRLIIVFGRTSTIPLIKKPSFSSASL